MFKKIICIINSKKIKRLITLLVFSTIILSGLINIFTYGTGIHLFDQSDFLEGIIWAKESLKACKIVSDSFNYTYIIPFGSNLIMLPFVAILGPCLLANQLGMLVYYVLYLIVIYSLSCKLYDEKNKRLYFVSFSSLFIFTYIGENILHHILYYGISFICFLGMLNALLGLEKTQKKRYYIYLLICVLWASINGIATIALSVFPVFLAYVIITVTNAKNNNIKIIPIIVFTLLFGIAINKIVIGVGDDGGDFASRFILTNIDTMVNNITNGILVNTLKCFYIDGEGASMLSVTGIITLCQILLSFVIIISIVIIIIERKKFNKLILLSSLFVILVCLAQFILTNGDNERFLFNGLLSLFVLGAIGYKSYFENNKIKTLICLVMIPTIFVLSINNVYKYNLNKQQLNEKEEIIDVLKGNNLKYGFAKYSMAYNVISNFDIDTISIDSSTLKKERSSTDKEYFKNGPKEVKEFFILLKNDIYEYHKELKTSVLNLKKREIKCGNYSILVYSIEDWNKIEEFNIYE